MFTQKNIQFVATLTVFFSFFLFYQGASLPGPVRWGLSNTFTRHFCDNALWKYVANSKTFSKCFTKSSLKWGVAKTRKGKRNGSENGNNTMTFIVLILYRLDTNFYFVAFIQILWKIIIKGCFMILYYFYYQLNRCIELA